MAAAKRFSQRMGYKPTDDILSTNEVTPELRNRLWNAVRELLQDSYLEKLLCERTADEFLKQPIDAVCIADFGGLLKNLLLNYLEWYEVYDLLEFLIQAFSADNSLHLLLIKSTGHDISYFVNKINRVLEEERSAYRIIGTEITPISSDVDKLAVEQVLGKTEANALFEKAHNHIQKTLALFSNRESPDYENTIKESISAIEAVTRALTGKENATLKEAIDLLREKLKLHPALVEAINRLYGYASDESGIRHAGKPGRPGPTQAEARLILVLASGIVGYLIDLSRDDF